MKEKMKGLLIGLTAGTLLSGSVVFADPAQIEVAFRPLRILFDGVEKKPAEGQPGFIYEGTTYVPLRFVSEALGKEVRWDEATDTIWIGRYASESDRETVAVYEGGQVLRADYELYETVTGLFFPGQTGGEPLLRELVAFTLLADKTDEEARKAAEERTQAELSVMTGAASQNLGKELAKYNLSEQDVRQYLQRRFRAIEYLKGQIDDAALQAEYDRAVAADPAAFTTGTVRHILIGTTDPATGNATRTKEEALARAREVLDKLNEGGDFAELAGEYSDDPGSSGNGGVYEDARFSQYVEPFRNAAMELALYQVSQPVETEFGYHLLRVEKRETQTVAEAEEELRNMALNSKFQDFMNNELPALIQSIQLTNSSASEQP